MINSKQQTGFTLVEIAIVLVIIGLLLGGILKGQELINSAKVRNLADQNSGIQAAYFGFIDRYRQVPGDWQAAQAATALGVPVAQLIGGNGNGRIENTIEEAAAVWTQLSRAQFLSGGFTPAITNPGTVQSYRDNQAAPLNAFNGILILTRNAGYTGSAATRLNLHMGRNVPVNIARELDIKVDDGLPNSGVLRLTKADSGTGSTTDFNDEFAEQFVDCTTVTSAMDVNNAAGSGTDVADIYDIFDDSQDCGQVFIY